ncbi:MAG TPA: polyphosphate kinase 2 [Acidimicrobiales bacterium]
MPASGTPGAPMARPPQTMNEMEETPPYADTLKAKMYEAELRALQIELLKLQRAIREDGRRVVILFEGRDAAGKGGSIKRFTENLNPRGGRVVALTKPNETELGQWYFQRYVAHLPTAGEIVMFDRSWYNRAGVERVMGFCTPREYMEFMRQAPGFERSLVASGISLFKLWFAVAHDEQRRRFEARRSDPLRRWKLSPIDEASLDKFDAYTEARNAMFFYTDTAESPWTVVNSNEKRRARLEAIRSVLHALDYEHKDTDVAHAPDPLVVQPASALEFPPDADPLAGVGNGR